MARQRFVQSEIMTVQSFVFAIFFLKILKDSFIELKLDWLTLD